MLTRLVDIPGFFEIIVRYQLLSDSTTASRLLDAAEGSIVEYRHAARPRFPEIPFVEELYNGAWIGPSDQTFAHGFNESGKLVLIKWHNSIVYEFRDASIDAVFINRLGQRYQVQVVRRVELESQSKITRVLNLSDSRSFYSEYNYDDRRLVMITTRHLKHTSIDARPPGEIVIDIERNQELIFTYSPDGKVETGPEGNW